MTTALVKSDLELSTEQLSGLIDSLARGEGPTVIAKRLHPNDRIARQRTRRKLEACLLHDKFVAEAISKRAKLELMVGLIPAMEAAAKRAGRGRMDAIRFVTEATGFHNPRVRHEHSGEVSIKLDMPRPKFEQDVVAEAELIEE